jgi:hypothetical protein
MNAQSPIPSQSLIPSQTRRRVAVLIDGDHIPATFRSKITTDATKLGDVISMQLFCDLTSRPDWSAVTGLDVQHCKGRPGKNSADMALCIAALDMAYRGLAGSFLIVSNDRDFEPLIRHLQRIGFSARQMNYTSPPSHIRVSTPAPTAPAPKPRPPEPENGSLLSMVIAFIREHGNDRGVPIAKLNGLYQTLGFKISDTTDKSWRAWLLARPAYFSCDAKGPNACVRLAK